MRSSATAHEKGFRLLGGGTLAQWFESQSPTYRFGVVAGGLVAGAPVGALVVGAASRGTAGADVGGGATFAGWVPRPFSSTERGAEVCVDMI